MTSFLVGFSDFNTDLIDKKALKKYVFSSAYEFVNDFYQGRYNHKDTLGDEFKNGDIGILYPFFSAFDAEYKRRYVFSFFRHIFDDGTKFVGNDGEIFCKLVATDILILKASFMIIN